MGFKRIYSINEEFFSAVDSEVKAYWLGFLFADGNVWSNRLQVSLSTKDRPHLELFQKHIGSTHPLRLARAKAGQAAGGKYHDSVHFCVYSRPLCGSLAKLGIVPRKSLTAVPPCLSDDLMRHFWRGAVDGDGTLQAVAKDGRVRARIRLVGTEETCRRFAQWATTHAALSVVKLPNRPLWEAGVGGCQQASRLASVLYDSATVSLGRKEAIARQMIANAAQATVKREAAKTRVCTTPRCGKPHYSKGLCNWCWIKQWRTSVTATCQNEGCERLLYSKGLCHTCYERRRRAFKGCTSA